MKTPAHSPHRRIVAVDLEVAEEAEALVGEHVTPDPTMALHWEPHR